MDVVEVLAKQKDFYKGKPLSEEKINEAEQILGLSFADEYVEYLRQYGVASANGHEFTGIGLSERLNVVQVTRRAKDVIDIKDSELYVIEETSIDGIVIWQNHNGEIYMTSENEPPKKIANSMAEYIVQ